MKRIMIAGLISASLLVGVASAHHSFAATYFEDQTMSIEGELVRQGVTRETLKPGQRVIINGNPGRTPEDHRLRMVNITRPSDGWKWGGTFD
jgi:hypothetical protein